MSIAKTTIVTIALGLPGIATAALPPVDVSQTPPAPAIVLDLELQPSAPPPGSPATIEPARMALFLCACVEGSAAAGAIGAGIGGTSGALIGRGIGGVFGPLGIGIGSGLGAGAGGYLGSKIGEAHHRAFGHPEASTGSTVRIHRFHPHPNPYVKRRFKRRFGPLHDGRRGSPHQVKP